MCVPNLTRSARILPLPSGETEAMNGMLPASSCVVAHDYRDHAKDLPSLIEDPKRGKHSESSSSFPYRLYDMLQVIEEDGYADVVSWQPHGRCFVVRDHVRFQEILPRYFKLSKVASFQRQLNLYGFKRLTKGTDRGGYYHELFLRGKPFLIKGMTRVKVKGTKVRRKSNPDEEPNFWKMSWVDGKTKDLSSENSNCSSTSTNFERAVVIGNVFDQQKSMESSFHACQGSSVVSVDDESQGEDDIPKLTHWGRSFYPWFPTETEYHERTTETDEGLDENLVSLMIEGCHTASDDRFGYLLNEIAS